MSTKKNEEVAVLFPGDSVASVWVLAADEDVVVRFDDWNVVRALYQFVGEFERAAAVEYRRNEFRVLSASVEVDSPTVKAWRVNDGDVRPNAVYRGLGDGALLWTAEAEKLPLGEENALRMVILKVSDDGMLIVIDENDNEATIDLSALAQAGR